MSPRFLLLCAALAGAPLAHADATGDAKAHYAAGAAAYQQARYTDAIAEFQAAYQARPSGVLFFNIAQCYEKLGDLPSALRSYKQYLRETPNADDKAAVQATIGNLERRLQAKGVQEVLVYSEPTGAQVSVDEKPMGATPLSVEVAPGAHALTVQLPGYLTIARQVTVTADKSLELDFTLQSATGVTPPPAVVLAPSDAPPPAEAWTPLPHASDEARAPAGHSHLWTYVTAGAAGLALATGVGLGLAASHNASTLTEKSATGRTRAQNQGYADSASRDAFGANVAYGVSGALGAAAVAVFFVEGSF